MLHEVTNLDRVRAMAKRTLVDIYPSNYRKLQEIRREVKRNKNGPVPKMPAMVNEALVLSYEALVARYLK